MSIANGNENKEKKGECSHMYLNRQILWLNCCVYHPVSLHYPTSKLNLYKYKKRQNQWINEFLSSANNVPPFFYFYGSSFLWSNHYMSQCCITKKREWKKIAVIFRQLRINTQKKWIYTFILYYPNLSSLFLFFSSLSA